MNAGHGTSPVDRSDFDRRSLAHQSLLDQLGIRASQGSFYTPLDVAERLTGNALEHLLSAIREPDDCPTVLDPTCGTGSFLVATAFRIAERLTQLGLTPSESLHHVVKHCLYGTDIDETAVTICRDNLASLSPHGDCETDLRRKVLAVDSLRLFLSCAGEAAQGSLFVDAEQTWADYFPEVFSGTDPGFGAVVGNPPFLSQLQSETALPADLAGALVERYGKSVSRLTNTASIFLLGASEITSEGGVIALIQPISFLATRESAEIRRLLLQRRSLHELWFGGAGIFEASVEVVGVVLGPRTTHGKTRISIGREFDDGGFVSTPSTQDRTWSRPLARVKGIPQCTYSSAGVVGDLAQATADFRDQYYGLVGAVRDLPTSDELGELLRLATVGLIDLASFMWGERPTKFAKKRFERPVVDTTVLGEELRSWARSRARPKVIVSNQTKNLEVYVDVEGDVLPSVPLLTVDCKPHDLWLVASALAAPVGTLVAAERHLGAGMSVDVLKLSAKDVLDLPTPRNAIAWNRGAEIFEDLQRCQDSETRTSLLRAFALEMNAAFEVTDSTIVDWWLGRFPNR